MSERKKILLRLDPAVHDALARWAGDELRSTNAQIEFLLRRALADAGRLPGEAGGIPRRGRPRKAPAQGASAGAPAGGTAGRTDGDATGRTDGGTAGDANGGTTGRTGGGEDGAPG
ncbi:hypothetical protein Sru01_55600 [Sphaerisporangium rufum]|uniref:Toxin-antitoxin system HicB family antitoxin n=1 Tax=Sphaerisporangium rufum TaxID=1381558 RepID=A0A919V3X7_9ACTN|nr:hypothetical protein Sru01_55600 [Sphaerisporangium rufum]